MADISSLLLASLQPSTRKQAESSLSELSVQPGFLSHLLSLILDPTKDRAIRLAGSIYLKNATKLRWEDDVQPVSDADKASLRSQLVPAMIRLADHTEKQIRVQIAESVSLIAELDFPDKWSDLIDQLVASFSGTNYNVNLGVLQTAHSIFRHWRAHVRSDQLFTEINFVISKFMDPFLQMFRLTASLLLKPDTDPSLTAGDNYPLLAENMVILIEIYYDFTCQDLPPALEDSHVEFFGPEGWLHNFLVWQSGPLKGDPEDTTPSLLSRIKTAILEIAELFVKLYPEQYQISLAGPRFIQDIWGLIGSNTLLSVGDDQFVSQSLRFVSAAIRTGFYKDMFSSRDTISSIVEGVVIPNVNLREHEVEQFEDDPLEFIRADLSLTDLATRRHSAADVLQALVTSGSEKETTQIVLEWVNKGLQQYKADMFGSWKSKDSAIYLLTAIATRGMTTQSGVTSTNALVDVIQFFSEHVYGDLQPANADTVHPILQVDAIRFLYTFRNQLTKLQLLSVLPLLIQKIGAGTYVASTYAAITIDRVLFMKQENRLLFGQADIHEFANELVETLLNKILSAGVAEKIAENDHLMKCVMRVILTARQTLIPQFERILNQLVLILGITSKNPSNPRFDQFIFESIAGLMRFVVAGNPSTLSAFEQALFTPFTIILQQDIEQYIPYVFQVLAQMLDLHTSNVPSEYRSLRPFLMTPPIWQQKGSIPGLVKLIRAYLARDSKQMMATGQIASVLAIVQQRLIPSKVNDSWGFELLQAVIQYVSPSDLQQYLRAVIVTLLTRMQTSKTEKYVILFSKFLLFTMAIQVDGLTPDYVIQTVEEIQPGLWAQILTNFVIPQAPKLPPKERKLAVVGLVRMLTESSIMSQEPSVQAWPAAFTSLAKLFSEPHHLVSSTSEDDPDAGITQVDYEEQTAGYQAAYSKIAASESKEVDPVAYVPNPQEFVGQKLVSFANSNPQKARMLISAADIQVARPFVEALAAAGYSLNF